MRMTLRPVESWQLPFRGKLKENAYCALMAAPTCASARSPTRPGFSRLPTSTGCSSKSREKHLLTIAASCPRWHNSNWAA